METQTSIQDRYQAALAALVNKLQQDRYALAAILYGSLARGEAWERSDIDLFIVLQDGLERESREVCLVEDGINIWADIMPRSHFRQMLEGSLQGSIVHAVQSHSRLLFCKDPSIAAWYEEQGRIGARDQGHQLLRELLLVPYYLDKAEKWLRVRHDLRYTFLWILRAVGDLARAEVVLNGEPPQREAIQQALRYNPTFFQAVYADLIDGPKDEPALARALATIDAYLEERAARLFRPILDYLSAAGGMRTASELGQHFQKKVPGAELALLCEWLARKGLIGKAATSVRLTRRSQVILEETAYYCDTPVPDPHVRVEEMS